MKYEASLKYKLDREATYNSSHTAGKAEGIAAGRAEGIAEGRAEGIAEGERVGIAKGKKVGRSEGKKEGLLEVALKMKKSGLESEFIAEITGLPVEEIEKL